MREARLDRTELVLIVLVTLFACAWSAMVLSGLASALANLRRQYAATAFPTVTGQIMRSSIQTNWLETKGGGQTPFYQASIQYRYQVDGLAYQGNRYRFEFDSSESSPALALERVGAYPKGNVTIYFNPRAPEESLLRPGITGHDLFLFPPLAFAAFGALALRFIYGFWRDFFIRPRTAGVRVAFMPPCLRARLPRYSPLIVALGTMVVTALAATILINDSQSQPAPMREIAWGWIAIVGIPGLLFAALWSRLASGADDLVINREAGTVTLPRTFGRRRNWTIQFQQILGADLFESGSGKTYHCYPTLLFEDGGIKEARLADWTDPRKGSTFVTWLAEQIDR